MYKTILLVVIAVNNYALSTEICPDITALHDVSAYFNNDYEKSINFYLLENKTLIHVVRANVSVLCEGMVNSFRYVEELALINANISKILPEAFKQLPKLTTLSLAVNHLTSISKDQFKNLENLTVLYLSANDITSVDADAFSDLTDLKKIYLDKNRIVEIDGRWFSNNPRLVLINLAYNYVRRVQQEAFVLKRNSLEIRLQHNFINEVEPNAVVFSGDKESSGDVTIFMDHNKMTYIPISFIQSLLDFRTVVWTLNYNLVDCVPEDVLKELDKSFIDLRLNNNPITCPCMQNMTNFLSYNTIKGNFEFTSAQECYLYGVQPPPEWNSAP